MKLYGTPPTRAVRPFWVLRELEQPCELVFVSHRRGDHRTPEFLALNPAGRVPVLVDGDTVMTESIAICLYLAEQDPWRRLLPLDPGERAQVYRWLFFLATEVEAPLERLERHTLLYPPDKRLPQALEIARQECQRMSAVLEEHLRGREFMVGKSFSVADVVAAHTLDWARHEGLLSQALESYVKRMYARPRAPLTLAEAFEAVRAGDYDHLAQGQRLSGFL